MKYSSRKIRDLRQNLLCNVLVVGLFLALPPSTFAAPGDLDPTFGDGGRVITAGSHINNLDYATGMAIQKDGKIVVVGEGANGPTWDFAVVRYNTDGSLDTLFGGTGIILTPVGNSHDQAFAVAIQADGKIVVAGGLCNGAGSCTPQAGSSFAVVRYNSDGSLDMSFNGTGKVITSVGSSGYARSVAIQADGKIVTAGNSGTGSNSQFALVRYNADGSLDTTFNGTGKVITAVGDTGSQANSVRIQADGKIVTVGLSYGSPGFAVVRYDTDGTLDSSFDRTGIVITHVGDSGGSSYALAIQTDGKLVVAGCARKSVDETVGFAIVRYEPNGLLDTSFGDKGKTINPLGPSVDCALSVAVQTDGKIVAGGYSRHSNNSRSDFAVIRLDHRGLLDTTFNGTGKVLTRFQGQDSISAIAIQGDGNIVASGGVDNMPLFDFFDFAVVRYEGNSNSSRRTSFDFDGDGRADISVFRPSDRVWYLDRSSQGFAATQFGLSTDKITPADYDGDGKTDVAVYRDGTWYWLNSSDGAFNAYPFGLAGDIPLPADFTGDGKAELVVYRNGTWWTVDLSNGQVMAAQFGLSTDEPVPGDHDGDGKTDLAVFRPSTGYWYINRSSDNTIAISSFGLDGDIPLSGDFNGDSRADLAVFRPADGTWYIARPTGVPGQNFDAIHFGVSTDIPAPADYDGDGRTDVAVYRNGEWYLLQSTAGLFAVQFGSPGDRPIASAFAY